MDTRQNAVRALAMAAATEAYLRQEARIRATVTGDRDWGHGVTVEDIMQRAWTDGYLCGGADMLDRIERS